MKIIELEDLLGEEKKEKKIVFTHYINAYDKKILNPQSKPEHYDFVMPIEQRGNDIVFLAWDEVSDKTDRCVYIGHYE